jgi:hypothetical protein
VVYGFTVSRLRCSTSSAWDRKSWVNIVTFPRSVHQNSEALSGIGIENILFREAFLRDVYF